MRRPPEQYADTPNLWRVAQELATFKEPYKVLNMALAIARPMLEREKEASHEQRKSSTTSISRSSSGLERKIDHGNATCFAGTGKF